MLLSPSGTQFPNLLKGLVTAIHPVSLSGKKARKGTHLSPHGAGAREALSRGSVIILVCPVLRRQTESRPVGHT